MTASNLGARVTGWGFAIFTVGAVAWAVDGLASGQAQLLWSNGFLALVDLFGMWRWLGKRARFGDASRAEEDRSERRDGNELFSAVSLDGMPVKGPDGMVIGHVTDALVSCTEGEIGFLIVREGGTAGVGEKLRRMPWRDGQVRNQTICTELGSDEFHRLPLAEQG
jgi:sporulation protein YlmC with PRC-barrel domain